MTTNTKFERINKEVEGFEDVVFYLSTDQQISGISLSGLAALLKVGKKNIKETIERRGVPKTEEKSIESNNNSNLQPVQSLSYIEGIYNNYKINIIPSNLVTNIIMYYGLESKEVSEDTKNVCRTLISKFIHKGLHQWIKESVGAIESSNLDLIRQAIQPLLDEIKDIKDNSAKYVAIRNTTKTSMIGLDELLNNLESQEEDTEVNNPLLKPTEDGFISLEGWLLSQGFTLNHSKFMSLAKLVAANFKVLKKKDPEKRQFTLPTGRTKYNVNVYPQDSYPILITCLNKLTSNL
jgi:hypothetical protein